jgi:hypothetical protein
VFYVLRSLCRQGKIYASKRTKVSTIT